MSVTYAENGKDVAYNNLPLEEMRKVVDDIRHDGYELVPMFVFGGGCDTTFMWAVKTD